MPTGAAKLALLDHVHGLDAGRQSASAMEGLAAEHWPDDTLDGTMVLLDDIVQILHLAQLNRRAGIGLNAADCEALRYDF